MDAQESAGPEPKKLNLVEKVAAILREDISIPYSMVDHVALRQPPINGDDHDSWDSADKKENWYYIAASIIDTVDKYRLENS